MPKDNIALKWTETTKKTPTPIADSMGDTTTNLVDHTPEVDPVINDAVNLPISAFDLAPASSLETEVPDHEKEQEIIVMEDNKNNSDVPIEVDDPDETTIGTRRLSRLLSYSEKPGGAGVAAGLYWCFCFLGGGFVFRKKTKKKVKSFPIYMQSYQYEQMKIIHNVFYRLW